MADFFSNVPFDEFVRFLNGGYYLNTFEVGSVKIDPISWPTTPRIPKQQQKPDIVDEILNRPWIDPTKFTGSGFKKTRVHDEGIAKKKLGSDLPPIRKTNTSMTCSRNQIQSLTKNVEDGSCKVEKMVNKKASVSKTSQNLHNEEEEKKLEGAQRKLRELYELIENDKKKRRVQITGSGFEIAPVHDEGIAKKNFSSDLPPIKINNSRSSSWNQIHSLNKKVEDPSYKVKRMVNKNDFVSNSPQNLENEEEEKKLEGTKRKLREQYELIENEKKKRRVQIIDFLKPQPPCVQPPVKKQQRTKPVRMFKSTRKLPPLHITSSIC